MAANPPPAEAVAQTGGLKQKRAKDHKKNQKPTKEQARESQTGGSGSVDEVAYRLGSPALGDLGAPVVMVEYGDFQ